MRAALQRAGIAWREDSSNLDRSFVRNRVRLDLLPAFRSLHPAAEANLLRTAALLAEDEAALDAGCGAAAGRAATRSRPRRSQRAPDAVVRRALRRLAGFPAPRPVAAERLAALARSRSGAGSVPLGAGRVAERRYERIVIVRDGVRARARGRGRAGRAGRHALRRRRRALRARGRRCRARSRARSRRWCCAPPRPGERLPGARRTIARMLLEAQVPRSERARYPVVAVHGEPVALPGIAVAAALRRPTGLVLTIAPS